MAGGSAAERWPFLAILGLHALAVLLFTRGFLLTRTELSSYSRCSDVSLSPCSSSSSSSSSTATSSSYSSPNATSSADPRSDARKCWTRPAVDRLVIIVLDALRFDFVAPSTFFEEAKPWMDKLRVLQKLASAEGSSARIFKAIADPPTTSLQRLKGLTTGGLPTFIDVGNSFGAPAIVEDNLIYQLAKNGKRVLMMGDDTWLQLFPDHFEKAYAYPSFNVKDLHTVDNGCIEHLLPSLYREDWDVLIAHFLGVDHAGHIFGVDSAPMIEKLEQYNSILEKVVEVLKHQSGPGGLHENTFLIVMGDHGQTINGDHGGGTAEEVETSLFAMSLRSPPDSVSSILDARSCKLNLDGEKICVGSIQQLDFAVTIAALLGVPFPFGSIGRVNPELYALCAGTWDIKSNSVAGCRPWLNLEAWMQNYVNALCLNCWQVKRYIDLYSTTSVIGFPSEDLQDVEEMYSQAQSSWSDTIKTTCLIENDVSNESLSGSISILQGQVEAYSNFLKSVAELARSKWTEFDLKMMGVGLGVLLVSLLFHLFAIRRRNKFCRDFCPPTSNSGISLRLIIALILVAMRATSFLSNSYILAEGKVANFLLATTAIINFHCSIVSGEFALEEIAFLLLCIILRSRIDFGLSKQTAGSTSSNTQSLSILGIDDGNSDWMVLFEVFPTFVLTLLAFLLYKAIAGISCWRSFKLFIVGTIFSYILIAVHWTSESNLITIPMVVQDIGRNFIPRVIYAIGFGLLVLLAPTQIFKWKQMASDNSKRTVVATVAMLCAWSSTVLILSGRQGPLAALNSVIGAWCIIRSQKVSCKGTTDGTLGNIVVDPIPVIQWSLLAACLFFYTDHWCAFDGLRYGAAFIGFENFNLIRQGILLAIDTFGVSHILPIFGLPLLVVLRYQCSKSNQGNDITFLNLTQVFLSYGFITAVTTTLTVICVAIQRRHLMVWGLFAPKYVFDVVGLILTDILIFLSSLYYI